MREDVQVILQVQEIDLELKEIQARKQEIPGRRATLLQEATLLQAEAGAIHERMRMLLLEGRERESEMRSQEDRAAHYQGQLDAVRTNREFVTLLSEIKGVKERASAAEDRALVILTETEQLRARAAELEKEIERSREASAAERQALDAQEAELEQELAARRDRRNILAGRVGAELLRKYDGILRRNRLPALFALRGRACGNCYGTLPLQAASEIRRREEPTTCEHCGVILYVADAEVAAG